MTPVLGADEGRLRPPELRVYNVGATSGTDWLFRAVDLVIPPGGWLTVVGPSGSGKTTLLRLLAGLFDPTEGHVQVGGHPWSALPRDERIVMRRKFGYVQQQPGLLHASVVDNVAIPLRWRGNGADEATLRARQSLDAAGLLDSAQKNALSLSGGERQRLAFARAMATQPSIMLLDEFTNHQDPRRGDLLESMVGERVRQGASLVLVAHDLRQIERIRHDTRCDPTLIVLIDGHWRATTWNFRRELLEGDDATGSFLQRLSQRDNPAIGDPALEPGTS